MNMENKMQELKSNKITKSQKMDWKFGEKHREYIRKCRYNSINVAEGAVRAGKTIDNILAFAMELEFTEDKIHLATGSTLANAKLNIGEANGYGLEHIFRGRSRWGKFKSNECLYISTVTGDKVVVFSGGAKADSFKKIRGNSYGMWIATEINLHHNNTVEECFDRTLMAINRKTFWDLNPSNPNHWIYTEYIDNYAEKQAKGEFAGGFNYEHFTIYDNASLTKKREAEIISGYTPGTIRYIRNILGQRKVAEGLIYGDYANNHEEYRIDSKDLPTGLILTIGVDFGGNVSKHAFVLSGRTKDYSDLYIIKSRKVGTGIDPNQLAEEFLRFLVEVEVEFGRVSYIYTDSADQINNLGFGTKLREHNMQRVIRNSVKGRVNNRINATLLLMAQKRIWFTELAEEVEDALCEAVWEINETGEDKRLDDGSTDIDVLDAMEYSFSSDLRRYAGYISKRDTRPIKTYRR